MSENTQQYIGRMLSYVEGKDALRVQRGTAARLRKLTRGLSRKQLSWKPEPAKWSIGEIVAHLADTEIVASWRLRSVLTSNGTTIVPFDQDVWASVFQYDKRDAKRSLDLFQVLRESNLELLGGIPSESWDNYGMHTERGKETVAHLTRMFAGHDVNHLLQIEKIAARWNEPRLRKSRAKKGGSRKRRK
ncbi:MAG TPA: DinB family protein [Verrucomicrobiae bacterium]|nr:DinB family protein [Verrucomicrobiae bacterium]